MENFHADGLDNLTNWKFIANGKNNTTDFPKGNFGSSLQRLNSFILVVLSHD